MFNLKTKSEFNPIALKFSEIKRNYEYEVISESVFDMYGDEYYTKEHALKHVTEDKISICEDILIDDTPMTYRYVKDPEDSINIQNAKVADFGVIRMLGTQFKGKEFMYPLIEMNVDIQFLIYSFLTYDYIEPKLSKLLKKKDNKKYVKSLVGKRLYYQILDYANIKVQKTFNESLFEKYVIWKSSIEQAVKEGKEIDLNCADDINRQEFSMFVGMYNSISFENIMKLDKEYKLLTALQN